MIDRGQWGEFGQDTGVTPLLFYEKCHGIFNDHRKSGPRFNLISNLYLEFIFLLQLHCYELIFNS